MVIFFPLVEVDWPEIFELQSANPAGIKQALKQTTVNQFLASMIHSVRARSDSGCEQYHMC
jgi:hypothetical protein